MIKIAMTKGRIQQQVTELLARVDYDIKPIRDMDRELVVKTADNLEIIFGKANDVVTFLEQGIVDVGFVGKDTLDESDFDNYYELLDLQVGKCFFALAAYPNYHERLWTRRKRIASKYTTIAKRYFAKKGEDVEIIKLEGSVELGPVVGLSDAIVDIVETGNTLRANGLEIIEKISEVSTRLIANKASFKFKQDEILSLAEKLKGIENDHAKTI